MILLWDNGWWNALDSQKQWQNWLNDEINEIRIFATPLRSIFEKVYNRLSCEADSPIGSAKRGQSACPVPRAQSRSI